MDLTQPLSQAWLVWASAAIMAILLVFSLMMAPWKKIRRDSGAQNVYLGAITMVILIWLIRADLTTGINFHLLGASLLCLMFEWQFALLAMAVVLGAHHFVADLPLDTYALNWLNLGAVPVIFCRIMLYVVQRSLPRNFYIYIFINSFFVPGISAWLAGVMAAGWMYLVFDYSKHLVVDQYLPTLMFIMLPEAFCTGVVMTLLVVYKPRWVATFHDRWYLKNQ